MGPGKEGMEQGRELWLRDRGDQDEGWDTNIYILFTLDCSNLMHGKIFDCSNSILN